jgi:hypothetical protein
VSETAALAEVQPGDYLFLESLSGFVDSIEPSGELSRPGDPDDGRPVTKVALDTGEGPLSWLDLFADSTVRINRKGGPA